MQSPLLQRVGSVNLNYCGISELTVLHSLHINVPECNSGLTSVVRVTVPEMLINFPKCSDLSSLNLKVAITLKNASWNGWDFPPNSGSTFAMKSVSPESRFGRWL